MWSENNIQYEETKMAKTKWIVKALTAEKPGKLVWKTIKEFDSPAKAEAKGLSKVEELPADTVHAAGFAL